MGAELQELLSQMPAIGWGLLAAVALLAIIIGYFFRRFTTESEMKNAKKLAVRIVEEAEKEAEDMGMLNIRLCMTRMEI